LKRAYPRVWLFTDERQGEKLWAALDRLPRGAGLVFRHYSAPDRWGLAKRVRAAARQRGIAFVIAGTAREARAMRADGQHRPGWARGGWAPGLRTASAHNLGELRAAERAGAALVFVSPVFTTGSHPGAKPLGRIRFGLLARAARVPVAALGGMDASRYQMLRPFGASAWGAIDDFGVDRRQSA